MTIRYDILKDDFQPGDPIPADWYNTVARLLQNIIPSTPGISVRYWSHQIGIGMEWQTVASAMTQIINNRIVSGGLDVGATLTVVIDNRVDATAGEVEHKRINVRVLSVATPTGIDPAPAAWAVWHTGATCSAV